jgi:hypothetical protein
MRRDLERAGDNPRERRAIVRRAVVCLLSDIIETIASGELWLDLLTELQRDAIDAGRVCPDEENQKLFASHWGWRQDRLRHSANLARELLGEMDLKMHGAVEVALRLIGDPFHAHRRFATYQFTDDLDGFRRAARVVGRVLDDSEPFAIVRGANGARRMDASGFGRPGDRVRGPKARGRQSRRCADRTILTQGPDRTAVARGETDQS